MPSANCCITQSPSPDTLGPRIIRRRPPSRPLFVSSKYSETGSSCLSSTTLSCLSKQADIGELQAIFERKSHPSKDTCGPKSNKSSGSLASVKDRLKKHLPWELKVQKRRLQSSVGISEEEVERRAELRRIRQKRIQEELSIDFSYDSDAKSLPSIPGVESVGDDSVNFRASDVSAPCLAMRSSSRINDIRASPSLLSGYMETRALQLEARFSELSPPRYPIFLHPPGSQSDNIQSNLSNIVDTPGTLHLRQHSLPEAAIPSPEEWRQNESASSAPQPPAAPSLKPQRLSSNLSKSSWRLSFSSENRGAHLRSLSHDRTSQNNADGAPRPMCQWLDNQDLRSTSQALTWSEESSNRKFPTFHSHVYSTNNVDETGAWFDGVHLRGMNRSQFRAVHNQNACLGRQQHKTERKLSHQSLLQRKDAISAPVPIQALHVKKAHHLHPNTDSRILNTSGMNQFGDRLEKIESDSYYLKSSATFKNSISSHPHAKSVEFVDGRFNIWRKEFLFAAQRAKSKGKSVIVHPFHDLRSYASWSSFPNLDRRDKIGVTGANSCSDVLNLAVASVKDERKDKYANYGSTYSCHSQTCEESLHQTKDAHTDGFLDRTQGGRGGGSAPLESIELDNITPTKGIAERTKARKSRMKSEEVVLDLQNLTMAEETKQIPSSDANSEASGLNNFHPKKCKERTHEKCAKRPNTALDKARFYDDCLVSIEWDEVWDKDGSRKGPSSATCSENRLLAIWDVPFDCEKSNHYTQSTLAVKRTFSLGHLRKSTDNFHLELKKMETLEREKALRIANEAWGIAA